MLTPKERQQIREETDAWFAKAYKPRRKKPFREALHVENLWG